ncbi:unnamed protein product [Cuscuta campestris]|uniref:Uncharacterized protein n=1 Tax=Cuscuta campestris TaxID=132261 RepID=A0A484KB50_9ASTE|nr:unnamed protein product [Cuscuta campestris]
MDDSGNLLKQYPYVTSQDVDYLREGYGALEDISQLVRRINTARETEQANGREHVLAGPLLDVQSVHVLPKAAHKGRPVFVYGRIHVSYLHISDGRQMHLDIYNRSADDAEYISPTGGYLTLTWPDDNHWKVYDLWMKLDKTTIAVDLYLKIGDRTAPLAVDDILVGDTTKGFRIGLDAELLPESELVVLEWSPLGRILVLVLTFGYGDRNRNCLE